MGPSKFAQADLKSRPCATPEGVSQLGSGPLSACEPS